MELEDHDVASGLWFTGGGHGFQIVDADNAPFVFITGTAVKMQKVMPNIRQWICENPPPETKTTLSVEQWSKGLANAFLDEGWHLLWRGALFTKCEIAEVAKSYGRLDPMYKEELNLWPQNTRIRIFDNFLGESASETSWASLAGKVDSESQ